ncbi:MAG: hypothetical protein AAF628_23160 [Planctomycetota bacterium]
MLQLFGTAIGTLLVYATQILAGALLTKALCPAVRGAPFWGRALLLGPWALALQLLVYHAIGLPFAPWLVVLPWWPCLVLLRRRSGAVAEPVATGGEGPRRIAVGLALAVSVVSLVGFGAEPVHDRDAMHNFAVFGRVFAAHQSLAIEALRGMVDAGHAEYPPLVALNEALLFAVDEELGAWTVLPFFALAQLALGLLVIEAVWSAARPWRSLAVAALLLLLPQWLVTVGSAVPDGRLTATVLLLGLEARRLVAGAARAEFAGVAAVGAAALTKNEGVAVGAMALLVLAFWAARRGAGSRRPALIVALAVGAALVALWPLCRTWMGLHDEIADGLLRRLTLAPLAARMPEIVATWWELAAGVLPTGAPRWGALWPLAALAAAVAFARERTRGAAVALVLAWLAHLGLYTAVFATTPHQLDWHLGTAAPRLFMHTSAWPVLLLGLGNAALDGVQNRTVASTGAGLSEARV